MKPSTKTKYRWVIKAGSQMICQGGPLLIRSWMSQVAQLRKKYKVEVIWVTSGAIATAVDRTDFKKTDKTLAEKQALSAIGQPMIMDLYHLALQTQGLMGAQVLLTYEDLADANRRQNFQNTIEQLLEWGITPIINENDAVATQEIKFGDNDSLSARVAAVMKADRLAILTDVEGLFESDPRKNPSARLITELDSIKPAFLQKLQKESGFKGGTQRGTGGMFSKISAAKLATQSGVETWLVKGDETNILLDVAQERRVGTRIYSKRRSKKNKRKSK